MPASPAARTQARAAAQSRYRHSNSSRPRSAPVHAVHVAGNAWGRAWTGRRDGVRWRPWSEPKTLPHGSGPGSGIESMRLEQGHDHPFQSEAQAGAVRGVAVGGHNSEGRTKMLLMKIEGAHRGRHLGIDHRNQYLVLEFLFALI